jgi:hypothetical protein
VHLVQLDNAHVLSPCWQGHSQVADMDDDAIDMFLDQQELPNEAA